MLQPESEIVNAIKRCTEGVDKVRNRLPQDATFSARQDNEHQAHYAFLDQLPILCDPASFQLYVACIAHGVVLAVIDPVDIGRYCHLAQTAMSAWKLANPTARKQQEDTHPLPTKGNHLADGEDREAARDAQKQAHEGAPSPKGNHFADEQQREAARQLPDIETQNQLYKELRERGIPVPSEEDLRNNPVVALYFCDMARNHRDSLPPRRDNPGPMPGQEPIPDPLDQPKQAA